MKGSIKAHTVDRYLRPVREQIVDLVTPNSTVAEYGCGNGDLLFKLSGKIRHGIGYDRSRSLLEHARKVQEDRGIAHITFKELDLIKDALPAQHVDHSIASLLFHVLPRDASIALLRSMVAHSGTTIICAFAAPENLKQELLLWLDQRFTPHYTQYKKYRKGGYMEGLYSAVENMAFTCMDTFDPVIKIHTITDRRRS